MARASCKMLGFLLEVRPRRQHLPRVALGYAVYLAVEGALHRSIIRLIARLGIVTMPHA